MNFYTHVHQSVQDHYSSFLDYSKKKYVRESLMGLALLALVAASYCGYLWYQKQQNAKAFVALVEVSKAYEQAAGKAREKAREKQSADSSSENPWEDVQVLLEAVAAAHSGSSLAPFFTIYQSQLALDANHDFDTACTLMEKALRGLPKDSAYYDMFHVKHMKMLLDSPMQDVRDKAVVELGKIGADATNYCAPEVLGTLAAYHVFHGNMDQAIAAWKTLAEMNQSNESLIKSPWVSQAQEKLKTLNIEFAAQN
jgi:hypothetical protein